MCFFVLTAEHIKTKQIQHPMRIISLLSLLLAICCGNNSVNNNNNNNNNDSNNGRAKIESWVHHITKHDDAGSLIAEGDAYMEHHSDNDSMYVYVNADVKHDFGTVSIQCLVPGIYTREKDSCSFAYSDKIKLVCEFKNGCTKGPDTPAMEDYRAWFSVARVVPVDSMKEMIIKSESDSTLVLEGRCNDIYTFDFKKADIYPSRMDVWKGIEPQKDEILAVSNMSLGEFWNYMF